jgi:hypothetical protein
MATTPLDLQLELGERSGLINAEQRAARPAPPE